MWQHAVLMPMGKFHYGTRTSCINGNKCYSFTQYKLQLETRFMMPNTHFNLRASSDTPQSLLEHHKGAFYVVSLPALLSARFSKSPRLSLSPTIQVQTFTCPFKTRGFPVTLYSLCAIFIACFGSQEDLSGPTQWHILPEKRYHLFFDPKFTFFGRFWFRRIALVGEKIIKVRWHHFWPFKKVQLWSKWKAKYSIPWHNAHINSSVKPGMDCSTRPPSMLLTNPTANWRVVVPCSGFFTVHADCIITYFGMSKLTSLY